MKKTLLLIVTLFFVSTIRPQTAPENPQAELKKLNTEIVGLYRRKKFAEAVPLAQKSVQLTVQIFGKDHLETALALRNLGFVQMANADAKAAEDTFEKAYEIYKKTPGLDPQNGSKLAEMLENLAFIKYQERFDSSEKLFEAALAWREKSEGADSINVAKSLMALANISYGKKEYDKASKLFERLFEILSKGPGNTADEAVLAYRRAECSYRKAGREADFEPLRRKFAVKSAGAFKTIASGVVNGKATKLVKPVYSAEARQARAQGKVEVELVFDEKGDVIFACVIRAAHPSLIEGAEAAAYQSKFAPTIIEGQPVKVSGRVIYNFSVR